MVDAQSFKDPRGSAITALNLETKRFYLEDVGSAGLKALVDLLSDSADKAEEASHSVGKNKAKEMAYSNATQVIAALLPAIRELAHSQGLQHSVDPIVSAGNHVISLQAASTQQLLQR